VGRAPYGAGGATACRQDRQTPAAADTKKIAIKRFISFMVDMIFYEVGILWLNFAQIYEKN
jgi:hypothetical protein